MPRFFFHIRDGKSVHAHEGVELPDWGVARLHAISLIGRILSDEPERIGVGEDWCMDVTDQNGLSLFKLDLHVTASPAVREGKLKADGRGGDLI